MLSFFFFFFYCLNGSRGRLVGERIQLQKLRGLPMRADEREVHARLGMLQKELSQPNVCRVSMDRERERERERGERDNNKEKC